MNRKNSFNKTVLFAVIILTVFQLGCENSLDKDFYEITVAGERTHQIDVLNLDDMRKQKDSPTDTNEIAPKELKVTLEQCRALAMENNLNLKVQLIAPGIAAETVSAEEAKFEAVLSSSLSYSKTDTPTSTTLTGSKVKSLSTNLGVDVPLRTGGTLSFDAADSRSEIDQSFAYSTLNPSNTSDFAVSISQPLLKNAGRRVNMHSIRIAKYDQRIEDAVTKLEVIRVIAALDRVYWRLYAGRRELTLREKQYELAGLQLERARRFVDAGERSQVEVIRAEAGTAQRLEAIIIAENNVRDRQRELKLTLNKVGMGMGTETIIITETEPDPVHYELEREALVEMAISNRMEMLMLELQIAQDASTIDYLDNQRLPLVTVNYTYNINGLGPTTNDSLDLLYKKKFEDHRFGMNVSIPLGNQAAESYLRRAFYQRRQRLTSKENRKLLIEQEVLNTADQLEANWQRILASRQSAILEGRLYEAEMRQFEIGLRTSTDVLEAQTRFADAQSAEILALTEYQIAQIDMAYATGTLLGAAKVQWEPILLEN